MTDETDHSNPLANARWEQFAQRVAVGQTQADSYRQIYPASLKWKNETVWSRASELAKKGKVAGRVRALQANAAERAEIDAADVLSELAKIGFASIENYVEFGENGEPEIDLSKLTKDQWAAIAEVVTETNWVGSGENKVPKTKVRLKFYDKRLALVDIGKHLGMFPTRTELSGPDGQPLGGLVANEPLSQTAEWLAKVLAEMPDRPPQKLLATNQNDYVTPDDANGVEEADENEEHPQSPWERIR